MKLFSWYFKKHFYFFSYGAVTSLVIFLYCMFSLSPYWSLGAFLCQGTYFFSVIWVVNISPTSSSPSAFFLSVFTLKSFLGGIYSDCCDLYHYGFFLIWSWGLSLESGHKLRKPWPRRALTRGLCVLVETQWGGETKRHGTEELFYSWVPERLEVLTRGWWEV
jgi:hypothetical protein